MKHALLLVVALWYACLGIVFFVVRPELAYSFGHWLGGFERDLPALTAKISLPVLGPTFSSSSQRYEPLFWLVWSTVFIVPCLLLWRFGKWSGVAAVAAALTWTAAYALLVAIIALLVGFGLWLPFSAA